MCSMKHNISSYREYEEIMLRIKLKNVKLPVPRLRALWANICSTAVSVTFIPLLNSPAEIYFCIKASDHEGNNIPVFQYMGKTQYLE